MWPGSRPICSCAHHPAASAWEAWSGQAIRSCFGFQRPTFPLSIRLDLGGTARRHARGVAGKARLLDRSNPLGRISTCFGFGRYGRQSPTHLSGRILGLSGEPGLPQKAPVALGEHLSMHPALPAGAFTSLATMIPATGALRLWHTRGFGCTTAVAVRIESAPWNHPGFVLYCVPY